MRASTRLLTASLVAGLVQLPAVAGAQTRATWSIQGSGLFAGLGGDAYAGIDPGAGFELQIRRRLNPYWSLGCGFQSTFHSFSEFSGDVKLQGGFCEPRRLVDVGSEHVFPYVSARGSVLQQAVSDPTGFSGSANGLTANVGAGIMVPFGSSTSSFPTVLELGGSAGYTWFGDFSAQVTSGRQLTKSTGGGFNFILRVGLAVGLGGTK
jgi:hypothetical protein